MTELLTDGGSVADLCARWRIRELSVFGSAARGDMGPDSDVDILVSFDPDADWDLIDLVHVRMAFEGLLHRKVDLVEREALEASPNWIVRREILGTARLIHATS